MLERELFVIEMFPPTFDVFGFPQTRTPLPVSSTQFKLADWVAGLLHLDGAVDVLRFK